VSISFPTNHRQHNQDKRKIISVIRNLVEIQATLSPINFPSSLFRSRRAFPTSPIILCAQPALADPCALCAGCPYAPPPAPGRHDSCAPLRVGEQAAPACGPHRSHLRCRWTSADTYTHMEMGGGVDAHKETLSMSFNCSEETLTSSKVCWIESSYGHRVETWPSRTRRWEWHPPGRAWWMWVSPKGVVS
jgi:hypothetical protein